MTPSKTSPKQMVSKNTRIAIVAAVLARELFWVKQNRSHSRTRALTKVSWLVVIVVAVVIVVVAAVVVVAVVVVEVTTL